MPPDNPGGMHDDYAKLVDCYENSPDNTLGCDWVIPPGGGCEGGRVGDDYPYQDSQELPSTIDLTSIDLQGTYMALDKVLRGKILRRLLSEQMDERR